MNELQVQDFETQLATMNLEDLRLFISALENQLRDLPQIETELTHYTANPGTEAGVYARELKIPKGALIIGKIHKKETINVISSGEVSVVSQDGCVRVKAPYTFVSTPGAKRVIYAHEDTTWTCFHATGSTDLTEIENEFIAKDYCDVLESTERLCLG